MKTKRLKAVVMVPLMVFFGCKGKTQQTTNQQNDDMTVNSVKHGRNDSMPLPKVNVQVNKKYDEKGNLRMYDSTYTYSYTGPSGNLMSSTNDSVYSRFKSFFRNNYSGFLGPQYNDMFFNDSLFKYDFYNPDYFLKRFELNNQRFEQMFKQLDSLKNHFMRDNYPNGKEKKNEM